jgi:hypothetical protein
VASRRRWSQLKRSQAIERVTVHMVKSTRTIRECDLGLAISISKYNDTDLSTTLFRRVVNVCSGPQSLYILVKSFDFLIRLSSFIMQPRFCSIIDSKELLQLFRRSRLGPQRSRISCEDVRLSVQASKLRSQDRTFFSKPRNLGSV